MVLDNINAGKIAAHFGNKWNVVEYVGCWNNKTISFCIWQDQSYAAGFELTIEKPQGDYLETVKVKEVKRIKVSEYAAGKCLRRYTLPLFIAPHLSK